MSPLPLKISLALVVLLAITVGCGKKDGNLELVYPDQAYVVPGTGSNCTDIRSLTFPTPTSLSTDFFRLTSFQMKWKGSNYLVPAAITITITSPYLSGSPVKCVISGTTLSDTFGKQTVFPPVPSGTGFENDINMNNGSYGPACAIGCGGLTRVAGHDNQSFTANATVDFKGYSQDVDGSNTMPVNATSNLRLNF